MLCHIGRPRCSPRHCPLTLFAFSCVVGGTVPAANMSRHIDVWAPLYGFYSFFDPAIFSNFWRFLIWLFWSIFQMYYTSWMSACVQPPHLHQLLPHTLRSPSTNNQEPTETSKQPIKTRYLGHV
eukprot:sb/3475801/